MVLAHEVLLLDHVGVVETDAADKLFEFSLPGLSIGSAEVKPVQDALDLLKSRYGVE